MRGSRFSRVLRTAGLVAFGLAALVIAIGCEQPPPVIRPGADVSFDGLHRVSRSRMQQAWARPDLSLAAYDAILLSPTQLRYRTPRSEGGRRGGAFPLDEEQQQRVVELVHEEFRRELARSSQFAVAERAGPSVLLLQATLIDVVSLAPPAPAGRDRQWVSAFGEGTLVLELRDSETGEIVARAVDRQAAASPTGELRPNTRASATAEVRRVARIWARTLRTTLDQLRSLALEAAG